MNVVLEKITDNCSMDCRHCPYAKSNITSSESHNFSAKSKTVYVISGGEPFESQKTLKKCILKICKKGSYFRIATGGHIKLKKMYIFLMGMQGFLGINFGTDIFLRSNNKSAQEIWNKNWNRFSKFKSTWLTITIGEDVNIEDIIKILKKTSPKTVLVNEEYLGFLEFEKKLQYLIDKFDEIRFIEGYRHESS